MFTRRRWPLPWKPLVQQFEVDDLVRVNPQPVGKMPAARSTDLVRQKLDKTVSNTVIVWLNNTQPWHDRPAVQAVFVRLRSRSAQQAAKATCVTIFTQSRTPTQGRAPITGLRDKPRCRAVYPAVVSGLWPGSCQSARPNRSRSDVRIRRTRSNVFPHESKNTHENHRTKDRQTKGAQHC